MMVSHPYRAILLTADQLRHAYVAAELASRLEDDIRAGQAHMQDVVVHTEP